MMKITVNNEMIGNALAISILMVVLALIVTPIVLRAEAKSDCLAAGFSGYRMDWRFNTYCIKRVDQSDVVIPLSEVRK